MLTLLPFARFDWSAQALDNRRLGHQRIDCLDILQAISGHKLITSDPYMDWGNLRKAQRPWFRWEIVPHPVGFVAQQPFIKMWKGWEWHLLEYSLAICHEWTRRGFEDSIELKMTHLWHHLYQGRDTGTPPWLGDSMFHLAMQSLLVGRDPEYYEPQFPGAPEGLKFAWQ